jgi:type VI secretion system secreted protein VgrG
MAYPITVTTALGEGKLLYRSMKGSEELGRLFEFEVELLSDQHSLALSDLIGKRMTVSVQLPENAVRTFNGVVARFSHVGEIGKHALYRATLRPWLWLLTRRANSRIFQDKSVPDIIKAIFREHGLTDFSESLSGSYPTCEYRVQYRETDFNFVSRLMEESGIYYFFEHDSSKHTLVLADSASAHATTSGYEQVPYHPRASEQGVLGDKDNIDTWSLAEELEPGQFMLDDYDFERPAAELQVKLKSQHTLAKAELEVYDYPGMYLKTADGEAIVRTHLEEAYAQQHLVQGAGDVRGLGAGNLFTLTGFPREDQNCQYLVVSAHYELATAQYESSEAPASDRLVRFGFSAIGNQTPFRARRSTPKPVVHGPHTAKVVGQSGEEIWTDKYGRVKVQFHWDREGTQNEKSSCWVRVAQIWAGNQWGAIHIPRIGQEVVVEFLEGDPDRPLVTGRLYNAENMPPYALPSNQTQSGIKSRSSKSGSAENFNEIRFEDKKGEEQVFLQAEKNLDILVKNDETRTVKHDRKKDVTNDETTTIGGNRTETVTKEEKITIDGGRTEKVAKDENITIDGSRTETVAKDESITIKGGRTEKVAKDENITIDGGRTEKVAKDEMITINGGRTEKVAKDEMLTIDGGRTQTVGKDDMKVLKGARTLIIQKDETASVSGARTSTVGKDEVASVSGARTHSVGKDDVLSVSKKLTVSAGDEISLTSGAASITIKKSGEIVLKGVNIQIEGSGSISIKGTGEVSISGASIKEG